MPEASVRDKTILRASAVGVAANAALAAFKAAVGAASGSIAIVNDALNNLSDALSSLITIAGTKLAARQPDKKHPMGYGRIEYMSAFLIALLILYAGITSLVESVKKILEPQASSYTAASLLILAGAVLVKIFLGLYTKRTGRRVRSDSLIASGQDALNDSILSASTLAAALVYLYARVSLEAWLGALIALLILRSGWGMLSDTLSRIIGERSSREDAGRIRQIISQIPGVLGVYDLYLSSYGPASVYGSVHIEVSDAMTIPELDRIQRQIFDDVYRQTGVMLTGISIYAASDSDEQASSLRRHIQKEVLAMDGVIQMHGFYLDKENREIRLDIIVSFDVSDRISVYDKVLRMLQDEYPDYKIRLTLDADMTD